MREAARERHDGRCERRREGVRERGIVDEVHLRDAFERSSVRRDGSDSCTKHRDVGSPPRASHSRSARTARWRRSAGGRSCSAMIRMRFIRRAPGSSSVDELGDVLDQDAFLPHCWRGIGNDSLLRAAGSIVELCQRHHRDRLLLRLHDVGQLDVARLVQPQIGGDDGGQVDLDGLEAGIDFARDARDRRRRLRSSRRTSPAGGPTARRASDRSGRCRRRSPACRAGRDRATPDATRCEEHAGDVERLEVASSICTWIARSAPIARRGAQLRLRRRPARSTPTTTSVARPCSRSRSASSSAISSNGFRLILTPSVTTPPPSGRSWMRTL